MGHAGIFFLGRQASSAWIHCALTHGHIPSLNANKEQRSLPEISECMKVAVKRAKQATFLSAVSSSSGVRLPAPVALSLSVYLWMKAGPPDALMLASLLLMRASG